VHFHNLVDQFWPSTVDGLTVGAIYALIALGYTLVYGVLKLINFAHSEIFMIGTFASLFLQEFFALRYGRDLLPFPRVLKKSTLFTIGGGQVRNDKMVVFLAALVMMVVLDRFVNGTRLGRGIRATAQDPETAVLMGVNIDRVVVATFALGGMMAGVAAMLYGLRFENTQYIAGFLPGIKAFTAAVLGGIGNIRGALLGGLVLGLLETYGASVLGSQWKDVFAFAILVVVLMFRPTGLLGEALSRARA